jgi:hypothetical protein
MHKTHIVQSKRSDSELNNVVKLMNQGKQNTPLRKVLFVGTALHNLVLSSIEMLLEFASSLK